MGFNSAFKGLKEVILDALRVGSFKITVFGMSLVDSY
jgi:hypothetical protein